MKSGESEYATFLEAHHIVGLDSNILIALIEDHPIYHDKMRRLFQLFDQFDTEIWLSAITVTEIQIQPLQKNLTAIAQEYEELLRTSPFSFATITAPIANNAAQIGATYGLKVRDALILASLEANAVSGFITADADFKKVRVPKILLV